MDAALIPGVDRALIEDVRVSLRAVADPARAPAMQRYMKSSMPFYGVSLTPIGAVVREVDARHPLDTFEAWRDTLLTLWRDATHREERYVALGLASRPRYRRFRTPAALPIYEEFIVTGAWWDHVDGTAKLVRDLVRDHHDELAQHMRDWAHGDDVWKRRVAIISQLGLRARTDWPLLEGCIEANLEGDGREGKRPFWIRKAIGWALRDYARTDPDRVRAYVAACGPRLSGLSRREALKHL